MVLARGTTAALIVAALIASACGGRSELDAVLNDNGDLDGSGGGTGFAAAGRPAAGDSAPAAGMATPTSDAPASVAVRVLPVPGTDHVPLHLYISNQATRPARVDITVWIEDTYSVGGDFDAGGQHNWAQFDFQVPSDELKLHAEAQQGGVVFDETILVPAESWGLLTFWPANDDDPPRFTWDLFDHEVGPV